MATALTVTEITRAGIAATAENTGDVTGNTFPNDGRVWLLVRNAHATLAKTITIVTQGTVDGQAIADRVVSIAATLSRYIGPFPIAHYNDASDIVTVTPESTDIKINPYRV